MTREESILLFQSMHPDFFEKENIRTMPDEWVCEEMVLPLDKFEPCKYDKKFDESISFGYYQRDKEPSLRDKGVSLTDKEPSLADRGISLSDTSLSPRDISEIKKAVEKVDQDWPQYFTENQRIY